MRTDTKSDGPETQAAAQAAAQAGARDGLHDAPAPPTTLAEAAQRRRQRWRGIALAAVILALIWAVLTDFRPDAWVFGVPALALGSALVALMPPRPAWRLSPGGALGFVLWFAVQSLRGAIDVSRRAFAPALPLRPGFRAYTPGLPEGAPRVMFINAITMLPGTLSAEVDGKRVIVHMLDTDADLDSDLGALEARVAALFALGADREGHQ